MTGRARFETGLEVAVAVAALATVPLTVLEERGTSSAQMAPWEWAVWSVFALEFCFAAMKRAGWGAFWRLAVVILSFPPLPNAFALASLARVVRLARLLRVTGATALGLSSLKLILARRGLIYVFALTVLLIVAGGGCLSVIEPETV